MTQKKPEPIRSIGVFGEREKWGEFQLVEPIGDNPLAKLRQWMDEGAIVACKRANGRPLYINLGRAAIVEPLNWPELKNAE